MNKSTLACASLAFALFLIGTTPSHTETNASGAAAAPEESLNNPAAGAASKRPALRRTDRMTNLMDLAAFKAARENAKAQARAHYELGVKAFNGEQYQEAATQFRQALEFDPNPDLMLWAATSLFRLKDYPAAKEAYTSLLKASAATQAQKDRALDALGLILQTALSADAKRVFVAGLGQDASGAALGKLFGEAFNEDPKANYAYAAADAYAKSGDTVRAAALYRKLLAMPNNAAKPLNLAPAKQWLVAHKLPETPKHPHLRSVGSRYVETPDLSPQYQEELQPLVDVWGGQIKTAIANYLGYGTFHGKDVSGDVDTFKHRATCPLGAGSMDLDALLMQGISYYAAQSKWSDQEKQAVFTRLKIDPQALPKEWPLVDQIKALAVTYLNTDAERAPYLLGLDKNGTLMQEGKPFDTAKLSTMFSGLGWAIYVMSPDGAIYSASHRVSAFHHSSFLAASDVAGAGEMQVVNGRLAAISNKSGHYTPGVIQLVQTLEELVSRGLPLASLDSLKVMVGGQTAKGDFLTKEWQGNAGDFLAKFRNPDPKGFLDAWGKLGFANNPFPT